MSAKISFGREPFPSRVLACLLSAALAVSLCPLQGWSDETAPGSAPDQLTKAVPLSDEPEAPQLTKAVPLGEEPEVPQLMKAVPLAEPDSPEPAPSEAPAQDAAAKTVKVTFVVSDESTASWPDPENVDAPEGADPATADRVVEVPAGELLGALVPPAPVSSDDSLVFEGWQTEDYSRTYSADELQQHAFETDGILYAMFGQKTDADGELRAGEYTPNYRDIGNAQWDYSYAISRIYLRPKEGTDGVLGNKAASQPYWPWAKSTYVGTFNLNTGVVTASADLSDFLNASLGTSGFSLRQIINPHLLDTSRVVNMARMFKDNSALNSLSIPTWKSSNTTDMSEMFSGCSSLSSLDISGFDFSKAKNIEKMFYNCPSLTVIPSNLKFISGVSNAECFKVLSGGAGCYDIQR